MKIEIKGAIVKNNDKMIYDWFGIEAVSPRDVTTAIENAKGEDIEVIISSGGGDVYAGSEIYTALKEYKGNVVGKIVGIAGSAASIIAMGVKKLLMSPTAQIMIHKAQAGTSGNHKDFDNMSEILQSHDIAICNAYVLKTGMNQKDLLNLMDKETYFNAKSALEHGFVDEIMFDESLKLSASIGTADIPNEVIEKMRTYIAKQNNDPTASTEGAFFIPKNETDPEPPTPPENGEETQPISNIEQETAVKAQQKEFARLKLKLMGGITKC